MAQVSDTSLFNDANIQEYYALENVNAGKNGNTLTNNNSVAFATGKFSNAADFGSANTNKYLSVASSLNYAGGAYSLSLWFKQPSEITAGTYVFISVDDSVSKSDLVIQYVYNAGNPLIQYYRDKSGVGAQTVNDFVSLGTTWHHLVLSYDGSTITAYRDGASIGTISASGSGSNPVTSGLNIGRSIRDVTGYASGLIDDVGLFNRALTGAEILTLYRDALRGGSFLLNFA